MRLKKNYLIIILLALNGCGGGDSGGSPSSFTEGNGSPVINSVQTDNRGDKTKKHIILITGEDINISVEENKREAFKLNATDKSNITFYLTEGDFHHLQIDPKTGEAFFNQPTDYERKSKYRFKVGVRDAVGHETEQKIYIFIKDTENEKPPLTPINLNTSLQEKEEKYFITTWKTDNVGISNNNQIIIPTAGDGYNYSVDWGDGSSSKNLTVDAKHTYNKAGTYKIKIAGDFPRIYFGQNIDYNLNTYENDSRKILSIDQWGTNIWKSMSGAFAECSYLEGKAIDKPNLSKVKDMSSMFAVSNFNQNINDWNIQNVETLSMMFLGSTFNQPLGNWNTSNVTDMTALFSLSKFNQDIHMWDTSKVTSMAVMFFWNLSFNQNIGNWDTSSVTEMSLTFSLARAFNQNLSQWNTSNVEEMLGMFLGASNFNQNIASWNISKVKNMTQMFQFAISFNQNLEAWYVSSEINTQDMFSGADSLERLPSWYFVDKDINKKTFIVIGQNSDKESCKVSTINSNIEGKYFGGFLEFQKDIDKGTIIASYKNRNFLCEDYGRENQLEDCAVLDLEDFRGKSCVVGFNLK